jgi:predicted ATPase
MLELDFRAEMVGRDNSLKELQSYLEQAAEGHGNTVFVSGEAGIGKTRLVEELKEEAQSKGFRVLSGSGLYESLTPYMPFLEALKSGNMENLFAEEVPKVEGIYLLTDTGLLIKEVIREESELDPDLFASMLSTVGNFVEDSLYQLKGEETQDTLSKVAYGDYTVLIESGVNTNLAVIVAGNENEFLINDMRAVLLEVNKRFGGQLKEWDGDEERVPGIERFLRPLIRSGKYDGIHYGKEDPKVRRNLLFENVSLGLTRQAQTFPILLCFEDLQWADPSSLALMHYVSRTSRKCSLLLLGTYRPEDITAKEGEYHPLVETMQLMGRESLPEKMELDRLSEDCMNEFLLSLLGRIDFSDEFIGAIYKETEGNPLYVIELVKLLVDEEIIEKVEEAWKLSRNLDEVKIPSRICDVVVRRLNRVAKEDKRVLDYASVIGDAFTSEVLEVALDFKRVQLLERLRVLEKAHQLIHSHDGSYMFDHAKVREVLYSEIPEELRREYHAIIAGSIETLNEDDLDEVTGDLAYHYYHCKGKEKALIYLAKAAEEAEKSYSNEEAIRFYGESLEFEDDIPRKAAILKKLGAVYELIGDYEKSLNAYSEALELIPDSETKAEIWRRIGTIYENKGEYDESTSAYANSLDLVGGVQSDVEADTVIGIGNIHWCKGEYDRSLKCYQNALEIGERIGDKRIIGACLTNIANIHLNKGEYNVALGQYEKSLELRESAGDERKTAHTLSNIGSLHYNKGEYDKALERYESSLEILEKIGDQQGIAISLNNIGVIHEDRGEYDKALERYERSLDILEKIGDQAVIASSLHNVGLVNRNLGNLDLALENYEKSLDLCARIGYQIGVAFNCNGIAEVYLDKKDSENALAFCKRASELSEKIGVKEYLAASKRIYGMVYRESMDWENSISNFKESIAMFGEIGMDKELGESHYEFGLMWSQKGGTEEAREHLDEALRIFKSLKLEREMENAKKALDELD